MAHSTAESPGEAGDQTTSETVYTNYARQDEARNTTQWTVTGNTAERGGGIALSEGGEALLSLSALVWRQI